MKSSRLLRSEGTRTRAVAWFGLGLMASTLSAAETNAPPAAATPPLTPEQMFEGGTKSYNNWIELSTGGFITTGSKSQFKQDRQSVAGPFGGVSDFHYQSALGKDTTLTANGHALFEQNDYKLDLGVTKEKLGFLRFSYTEFRTWYNGDGGYYPPSGAWYPLRGSPLGLDRGKISFEAGLRLDNAPNVTFKYAHDSREGEKSSTIWGYTHPAGGTTVRGLSPSFYDVNDQSDTFQLDVTHHIKTTDFGAGVRYETGSQNDAIKITQFPGEAYQQKVTDRQGSSYDMVNVHTFTETWLKQKVMFSSGFAYSGLDNDFSGNNIYGSTFDAGYTPNPQNGFGFYGVRGDSHLDEYVATLNLMAKVSKDLTVVPSVRFQQQYLNSSFTGTETLSDFAPTPFSGNSDRNYTEFRERLDASYTGVTNWVFSARGEWTEGQGNMFENGGYGPVNGFGVPPILRQTDDTRFFQKYGANARWYPARRVTMNVGGYYKYDRYDYTHNQDSTPNDPTSPNRYPAYLVMQNLTTYDGNAGVTLRPLQNLTLISRYEYQWSTIDTQPDPVSGLNELQSSEMTSQIIGQDISWTPWSRLSLQVGFNYVLSETKTPTSDYTRAIMNSENDYWTLNFSSGFVVDDKTDLKLDFLYYRADDYQNNSLEGVPYGSGAEEYGVTLAMVRRISQNLRLNVKYGYYNYTDQLSGGKSDYQAHLIMTSLQYRF